MAVAPKSSSVAKTRWILILGLGALGVFLFLRGRKANAKTAAMAAQNAASNGATNPNPSVPTYSLSASGSYNGGYTPYTIVNAAPTNMSSTFPGATTVSSSNTVNPGGINQTTTTTQNGSG